MKQKTEFFVIEPHRGDMYHGRWAFGELTKPIRTGPAKTCPVCGQPVSMLAWLPPHRIRLSSPNPAKWGDFIWGAGFYIIVSSRFKKIYEENDLSGITEFFPSIDIVMFGRKRPEEMDVPLPTYHHIDYEWFGANQDDAASSLEFRKIKGSLCEYCRGTGFFRKQNRIVIDPESWTGADLFKPRGAPTSLMVSGKFKQVVEQAGLTNIMFIPAERYGYDEHRPGMWYINDEAEGL